MKEQGKAGEWWLECCSISRILGVNLAVRVDQSVQLACASVYLAGGFRPP